jgi:excisionase family DNA binding protein
METLYRKIDLAEQLNLSIGTIDNHMNKGTLKYLKIGKSVRFRDEDINEWISKYFTDKKIAKNYEGDGKAIKQAFTGDDNG